MQCAGRFLNCAMNVSQITEVVVNVPADYMNCRDYVSQISGLLSK